MTLRRKFTQVEYSLGINSNYDDSGQIERLATQVEKLTGLVVVLIGILERSAIISEKDSDTLDRVKYNYYCLDDLDVEEK